jgi:predicted nucleotidyltransferase
METTVLVENLCSTEKIADIYLPIINDAIAAYQLVFCASILSIRLMGSVARGEVNPSSDVDLIALLRISPSEAQMRWVAELEKELRQHHPFVSKIDLEGVAADDVVDFRRFVLATDSVVVFGSDVYSTGQQIWDRQRLAQLVTPDLADIVSSYRNALEQADDNDREVLHFYSRVVGKDILKCLRPIALLRGGRYERNTGNIYKQLLQYAPEQQAILSELHELYIHPSDDRQRLLKALYEVEKRGPNLGSI